MIVMSENQIIPKDENNLVLSQSSAVSKLQKKILEDVANYILPEKYRWEDLSPFTDISGKVGFGFEEQLHFHSESYLVRYPKGVHEGNWGQLKIGYNPVINAIYDNVEPFNEGFAAVKIGNKWGYINEKGEFLIEPKFDKAYFFVNNFAWVVKNKKYGFIKLDGSYLIEPKFDKAISFQDNVAMVKADNKWSYIKTDGSPLFIYKFNNVHSFKDGKAFVQENENGAKSINRQTG